jgi:phenylacetate-CoA ligase
MSDEDLSNYYRKIVKYEPAIIYGYTSSIKVIAEYMKEHKLTYNASAVIPMGSKLLPSFRKLIEDRFKCRVYDGYGCGGEGLNIAAQCELGNYHINEELMIVETDNNDIVVTSLDNYAMPLIRYKPDDRVTLGKQCECGKNLATLSNIEGRSHEVVKTRKGEVFVIEFFISAFEHLEGILQYKIIQESIDGIIIQLVVNESFNKEKDEKSIKEFIQNSTGKDLVINIQYVKKIVPEKSGKLNIIETKL